MNDDLKQLIWYAWHRETCGAKYDELVSRSCSCGLSRLIADIREDDRRAQYQPAHDRQQRYFTAEETR